MPKAELIAIGTELLLGEIQDTNTRSIARMLREINVDLFRSTIIGDNLARISAFILEALERSDIVIATGGLGPTVDDYTREAAAKALNVDLEFQPELWERIKARYSTRGVIPSENNQRQALIPASSIVVNNPVGTAPGFILKRGAKALVCLPGVPREMETLMQETVIPFLIDTYDLQGMIKVRVLHVSGVPESRVDQLVADYETWQNPTVGLLAHPGIVDIRITAKADSEKQAEAMIRSLEDTIRIRFGNDIFGADEDTLIDHVHGMLSKSSQSFIINESGEKPLLKGLLESTPQILRTEFSPSMLPIDSFGKNPSFLKTVNDTDPIFYFVHWQDHDSIKCISGIISPNYSRHTEKTYLGPVANGDIWITNNALDFIRRTLPEIK